ncbi:c-type cytochrome domain-containing protein [Aquirufa sp. ROCK-SH2]
MKSKLYDILLNIILFLQVLLVFALIFQDQLVLPFLVLGRLHPLILHLPIGLGFLLALMFLIKGQILSTDFYRIFRFVLYFTSLLTALTALFGLFLSLESGYDTTLITYHQWAGIVVNFYYVIALFLFEKDLIRGYLKTLLVSLGGIILLVLAGHGGANLTHGEAFLFPTTQEQNNITQESLVFHDLIQPILKKKCESCHNDQKTKGQLNMSSVEKMLKGGKHGSLWKAGDVLQSLLTKRIELPLDAKEHMPPKGKEQLTPEEIILLRLWVKSGASLEKKIQDYPSNLGFAKWISQNSTHQEEVDTKGKIYDFSAASESEIADVNTPFCSVRPISSQSPALEAEFFVAKKFDIKTLENLNKVAAQLVALNISKMPIKDADLKLIAQMTQLEKLNLNFTEITSKGLSNLEACQKLNSLSLAGTNIQYAELALLLRKIPALKEVFIWNTDINTSQIQSLTKAFPTLKIEQGYVPKDEKLYINPPILVNENLILKPHENVLFKHTLKGVDFHYTLNDSTPDSLGNLITRGPIPIQKFAKVKILATKEGWLASKVLELKVFKSNFIPDSVILFSEPEPKYKAQGSYTLKNFVSGARYTKGVPNHTWLGFNGTDFEADFMFARKNNIKGLTFSYLEKTDEGVFPPKDVEVLGLVQNTWKSIGKFRFEQPTERKGFSNKAINIDVIPGNYSKIKLKATIVKSLPKYLINNDKKEPFDQAGKPAKLRMDEIIFY